MRKIGDHPDDGDEHERPQPPDAEEAPLEKAACEADDQTDAELLAEDARDDPEARIRVRCVCDQSEHQRDPHWVVRAGLALQNGAAAPPNHALAKNRKDDRGVFESLALGALEYHEKDPEFQRLLLHSALEKHELAQMFFDEFVRRVYEFLGAYLRERQREGALVEIDPAIVVRCFIGMVMHHSLNNNLWDPKRRLLNISNESAAKHFTDILLNGITSRANNE